VWSPTKINTLLSCPKQYFYRYVAKNGTDRVESLELGKATHEILAKYLVEKKNPRETIFEVVDKYQLSPEARVDLILMIPNIEKFGEKLKTIDVVNAYSEYEISVPELNLYGIVDLILELPNKHFAVIDFKTSKSISKSEDYERQMLIYSFLVANHFQAEQVSSLIFYVRHGLVTPIKVGVKPEELLDEVKKLLDNVNSRLEEVKEHWPANPSWKCRFCPYQTTCEALQQK